MIIYFKTAPFILSQWIDNPKVGNYTHIGLFNIKRGFNTLKANYHTHTTRCQHATGTEEEYIACAIAGGFDVLGFSDHAPWQFQSNYVSRIRMLPDELPGYIATIAQFKEKYKGQITLYTGLECEYFPEYLDWLDELSETMEYLILGAHFAGTEETNAYVPKVCNTDKGLFQYVDNCIAGMETGKFAYLAHPDLFMRMLPSGWNASHEKAANQIVTSAKTLNIPLEYNLNANVIQKSTGIPGYPRPAFWECTASHGAKAIIGADAHAPQLLANTEEWDAAVAYLTSIGWSIEDRLPFDNK